MRSVSKRCGDLSPYPATASFQLVLAGYRPDIDGLRAVAVLAVVVFHAFPTALSGGFVGVDVSFVISGFLISRIILEQLEHESFSLASFYVRRVKRIFPALIVVLAVTYGLGWIILFGDESEQLGKHVAGSAGFAANLLLWQEAGYFDMASDTKPLLGVRTLHADKVTAFYWPHTRIWELLVGALLAWGSVYGWDRDTSGLARRWAHSGTTTFGG